MEHIVSRTLSAHKEHEVLLKLKAAGLTDNLAQKLVGSKGNNLAIKVVHLILNGGPTSQKHARAIMGANYFGVEEAIRHFGINPSRQQLVDLSEVPFTEAILAECKSTHILVAIFPLSIMDVRGKVEAKLFYDLVWYDKQSFARGKGDMFWCLVRKTPVANSISKTWDEQQALLAENEHTPSARIMVYTIIGHFLATGERLFENIYVRCSDLDSGDDRVDVGDFDADGLRVDDDWDDDRRGSIGVSVARKFD